jgi:aspartate kinase
MKFGGSSVADAEAIRHCASIVRSCGSDRVVAVVSAMSGVTDMLIELAQAAAAGTRMRVHTLLGKLHERHELAARALGAGEAISPLLSQLDTLVAGIGAVSELTPRSHDAVVSFGERLSAAIVAAAMNGHAMTGHEIGIVTDDRHTQANPLMKLSLHQIRETLQPRLERGEQIVVTGFIAATQHGAITSFGRGGSDLTATLVGAALPADEVCIWSDVDGLMTGDPRIVPEARLLDHITFAEAIEMGQFGAKSMHPRALEPAAEYRIPVRMRNTFNPGCAGTLITDGQPDGETVRSVLRLGGSALVTIAGAAMIGQPGTAARVFQALADVGVNVQVISQTVSEAGISVVIPALQLDRARAALESRLIRTGVARKIEVQSDIDVVAVVGAGMAGVPGIAARVFGAVARDNINVMAIAQGSSELTICFIVKADASAAAVRALHGEFGLAG